MTDEVMQQQWCCLTCSARFRFGRIRMVQGQLQCPTCTSTNLHPATGEAEKLDAYHGEIGPLQ